MCAHETHQKVSWMVGGGGGLWMMVVVVGGRGEE